MNKMMNDPRMQELLQKLMNRPESLSSTDLPEENIDDALQQKVESPDQEFEVPEDIKRAIPEIPTPEDAEVVPENIDAAAAMKVLDPQSVVRESEQYQGDPGITAALRKLKAGQPMASEAEVQPENIDDPSIDSELRKSAWKKVNQKYLGR